MISRTWARHYQDDWQTRSGDRRLPYWLRVAAAGYGVHGENGHATFKRGQLALILATVDPDTGQIHPYSNVGRAITDAVDYGWLEEGSYWGCLIVPAHSIRRGDLGRNPQPCPLTKGHARARYANRSLSERYDPHSSTPDERFATRTAHSLSASTLNPLCSDSVPQPHREAS